MSRTLLIAAIVGLGACETSAPRPAAPRPSTPTTEGSAAAALDRLDRRQPLPLLPMMAQHQKENMREHLVAVRDVVSATASRDFGKVTEAAKRLGYSEAMGRMCEHMGAATPGFTEQALAFHHTADRIAEAARAGDEAAVLSALAETLTGCTGCHEAYKQKLVEQLPAP
jgi:hypothetical protein